MEDSRRELDESRKRKMIQHGVHQNQMQRARTNAQQPFHSNNSSIGFRTPVPVSHAGNTGIPNVNNQQPQRTNNSAAGIQCYNCREIGHYANKCPQKQGLTPIPFNLGATPARTSMPGAGRGVPQTPNQATGTPSTASRGMLNHVTAQEVQPVQNVVSGKSLR